MKGFGNTSTPQLLIVLILALAGFWFFAWWSGSGWGRSLDLAILSALTRTGEEAWPIGPEWLREAGRDLTALGSISVLLFMSLAVSGWLALTRRWRRLLVLLVAIIPGVLLSFGLKLMFSQPRPDLLSVVTQTFTSSFPSSHAMASLVVYVSLAAIIGRTPGGQSVRGYLLVMALLVSFIAGFSRVYLGVHWPSDVLAGWAAGAAWLALIGMAAQRLDPGWAGRRH